jgi:hypothetical protein
LDPQVWLLDNMPQVMESPTTNKVEVSADAVPTFNPAANARTAKTRAISDFPMF